MKKLWLKLKALVDKQFAFLKKHLEKGRVAVAVVNALKEAIDNPVADVLVHLTKTDLDDKLLEKARIVLPVVLTKLAIAHGIIAQAKSNSDVYGAVLDHIRKLLPEGRALFLAGIAGDLNVYLSDGKMSWSEGVELAQKIYREYL